MRNVLALRTGPQPQALHFSYEKAGLTVYNQPIPWNAEAVIIEALLRFPSAGPRRKADFLLHLSDREPIPAESLRRVEGDERHRLLFRLPPLACSASVQLTCQGHMIGSLTLPVVTEDEFIRDLRLHSPTVFVRLGDQSVACQTFVATQCRGLIASAILSSPIGLAPLLDLGLSVEFRPDRGGQTYSVPARFSSSQLGDKQAMVTIVPRKFPRKIGSWSATWIVGERRLATHQVRSISQRTFQRSLRIVDTRYVIQSPRSLTLTRHPPDSDVKARVGPCFLVSSREPGMAGICPLQVRAQVPGSVQSPLLQEIEVLISDGPTIVAPGTVDVADLQQVSGFELRLKGTMLGVMSLSPAPTAAFTAEGGFKAPQEFSWSPAADDELNERLTRLLEGKN